AGRPAHVDDRVQGGPRGAAREEYVVNEDDTSAVDVEVNLGALDDGLQRDLCEVVAVEGYVELAYRRPCPLELVDEIGQPLRQRRSARVYAHQRDVAG